jgi:hypothetical protein
MEWCGRIDAGRLVTGGAQHGDESAQRPAPDLDHPGRCGRQLGADERPYRGEPSLMGRHVA